MLLRTSLSSQSLPGVLMSTVIIFRCLFKLCINLQLEAEQLRIRMERLAALQARLQEASIRAKQFPMPAKADQLFAVLKTAETLNDSAVRQQAPVFVLNQLDTTVQLAERLLKLYFGVRL